MTVTVIEICRFRIQQYARTHNRLPLSLGEIPELAGNNNSIMDGWDRQIIYSVDANGNVTLASYGKDAEKGGTGDNADIIGIYASRQPNGKWTDDEAAWIQDPKLALWQSSAANPK